MVHQQLLIFPQLTALENILVGAPGGGILSPGRAGVRRDILELCRAFGFDLPLDAPVIDLSFAQRQQIELLRALHRRADILILDEPTSLLSPPEVDRLLDLLRSIKGRGHTLLFVSHRLSEVFAIADTITVMQKGRRIASLAAGETSPAEIARLMVMLAPADSAHAVIRSEVAGKDQAPASTDLSRAGRSGPRDGETLLKLEAVCTSPQGKEAALRGIDLELRPREVLGIGGIVGNGQRALARVVGGLGMPSSGRVFFEGGSWENVSLAERLQKGFRWLPANLMEEGFCAGLSLWENYLLGRQHEPRFQTHRWLRKRAVRAWTEAELGDGGVRFGDVRQPVSTLSGGNVQRMGLLRTLSGLPRLVLLEQPGRGLDLLGQEWLCARLRGLCERGVAVLVISYDLDELLRLCHYVGVLYRGRLMGIAAVGGPDEEMLVPWMTGIES
jgi:simple sugar transport system ATP-binding protein